jgi:hypothetical protein
MKKNGIIFAKFTQCEAPFFFFLIESTKSSLHVEVKFR